MACNKVRGSVPHSGDTWGHLWGHDFKKWGHPWFRAPATCPLPRGRHGGTESHPRKARQALRLVAIGILMERFRLTREMAEQRLLALARQASRPEAQYALELVRSIDSINAVSSSPGIR